MRKRRYSIGSFDQSRPRSRSRCSYSFEPGVGAAGIVAWARQAHAACMPRLDVSRNPLSSTSHRPDRVLSDYMFIKHAYHPGYHPAYRSLSSHHRRCCLPGGVDSYALSSATATPSHRRLFAPTSNSGSSEGTFSDEHVWKPGWALTHIWCTRTRGRLFDSLPLPPRSG